MDFSVLGGVEASLDGRQLPLGGPRQRALLARLLTDSNRAVSADRLAEDLWDEAPNDAHAALQNQVSRLRKVLGDRIVTKPPGYLIRVEPGELDLDEFRARVARAGAVADPRERAGILREADALFRGPPLADVEAPFAETERAALEELRLAALEARVDAELDAGRHSELVPELGGLVRAHPLRERLRGQLILALYRCGRQADALAAYRDAKRTLDEELGLEPGPALRELERAILNHDDSLAAAPVARVEEPPRPPPAQSRRTLAVFGAAAVSLGLAGAAVALVLSTRTGSSTPPPVVGAVLPADSTPTTRPRTVVHHHVRRPVVTSRHRAPKTTTATSTVVVRVETVTRATTTAAPRHTTTTTTATTRRPPVVTPALHTAPPTVTYADDFSETTPNLRIWNVGGEGVGDTWAVQNGQAVFTIAADAQPGGRFDQVGPVWGTRCSFGGDFDARVDYHLVTWPPDSGARVQLNAWVNATSDYSAAARASGQTENYAGNTGSTGDAVGTSDTKGTLRLTRVGGTETAYYLAHGKWMPIHSGQAPGNAQLGIQLFATSEAWQHVAVSVAFDNFKVTGTRVSCS